MRPEGWEQAIEAARVAIEEHILPLWTGVCEAVHAFREQAWVLYRAAGMPYGESDEGMWRWLQEQVACVSVVVLFGIRFISGWAINSGINTSLLW